MKGWAAVVAILLVSGCVRHIYPGNGKVRGYEANEYAEPSANRATGSLWSDGSSGFFEDARARRVGDILTVRVDERADATRDASTRTGRKSDLSAGVSAFFVAMQRLAHSHPGLDPSKLLGAATDSNFEGVGSTSRSGTLDAVLPVRIKKRLPNGDFFVEGNKVVLVNEEESYLYLSGVVRPVDLQPDNSVSSSVLADVELEFTGRGVVSERQTPGWFSRILDYVWPF